MQELFDFLNRNADPIIALCALFVSVASFLIAYHTLKSQRKHDRLSVRPIGKIQFVTSPRSIAVELHNDGSDLCFVHP